MKPPKSIQESINNIKKLKEETSLFNPKRRIKPSHSYDRKDEISSMGETPYDDFFHQQESFNVINPIAINRNVVESKASSHAIDTNATYRGIHASKDSLQRDYVATNFNSRLSPAPENLNGKRGTPKRDSSINYNDIYSTRDVPFSQSTLSPTSGTVGSKHSTPET